MGNLLSNDLECFKVSVLGQAWGTETEERLWHEDTSDRHIVARGALAGVLALSSNLQCAGHVTDRHLIAGLLNFDVLEAHEF